MASRDAIKRISVPRIESSKKGDNGTILVAGGSRFYHGAPILASIAAYRAGADLVYTAIPRSIITAVRSFSPSIIALPLPDDKLTIGSANRLVAMMPKKADSAAIGMGMSIAKPESIVSLAKQLLELKTRLVLDASALIPEVFGVISGTGAVVTPHAGEFRRLFGTEAGASEKERVAVVQKTAKKYGITILLKGFVDVISDGERDGINRTHNPAMTVGGTGDVLAGLTASLLSRFNDPFNACMAGAYFNGMAGNLAYKKLGLHILPTDLLENIPQAMKPFDAVAKKR